MTTIYSTPMAEQRAPPRPFRGSPGSHTPGDDMLTSNSLSHRRKKTTESGMVKEFLGFFRKTSPPRGNYKSTLEMSEGRPKKRDRLSSLWPFRKKHKPQKGSKPQRGRIKLPDSAVAGTTTGGHRHIAISIPVEHAHLEPAVLKPNTFMARPHGELDERGGGEGRSQYPDKHRRSETPSITNSGPRFPPRDPTGPNNLAGPRSVVATSARELEPLKSSASTDTYLTNPWSEQRQPPRQQRTQGRSTKQEMLPNSGRSMNRQLLRKRSSSESFYTTTSELISSDAVTVCIPSPSPGPPDSLNGPGSDTGTDRHSTVGPAPSRTTIDGWDTRKGGSTGENSSQGFNFSAPENECSSRASNIPQPNWPFSSSNTAASYHPHALSNITSLESLLPSSLDSRGLRVAPIMTVVDIKPSSSRGGPLPLRSGISKSPENPHHQHHLTRTPDLNNERRPRRAHALSDIRSTNHSHASLPVAQPSNEDEASTSTPHLTTATNSGTLTPHATTPSNNPASPRLSHLGPHENRNKPGDSEGEGDSDSERECESPPTDREQDRKREIDFLYRYTARLSQTHDREIDGLLARIDRLEKANTRWTSMVVPLLGRVSRQLREMSSSAGAGDMGSGGSYFPEAPAGAGAGVDVGVGARAGATGSRRSPSPCSVRRSDASGLGPGYYDTGGVFTPTRLESIAGLDSCDLEEGDDGRHCRSVGDCAGSSGGGGRRGVRDSGIAGVGLPGDRPRLRSDSFANAGYLDSHSMEVVCDTPPYCRGALVPPDRTPPMSMLGDSSRDDDDRETTTSERQASSSVRQQQPEGGNLPPNGEEGEDSGDASGLGAIEGLMRELIPTTRLKD